MRAEVAPLRPTLGLLRQFPDEPSRVLQEVRAEGASAELDAGAHLLAWWARVPLDQVASASDAFRHWCEAQATWSLARRDTRVTGTKLDLLRTRTNAAAADARKLLGPIVGLGLEAREGEFLKPPAVVPGEKLNDWLAWSFISMCLKFLGAFPTITLCVCDGCTAVFRPRRRRSARYCQLCAHNKPAAALGAPGEHPPLNKKGDKATIRVPRHAPGSTTHVIGWGYATVGLCSEDGKLIWGREDKITCSGKCRHRRSRRV